MSQAGFRVMPQAGDWARGDMQARRPGGRCREEPVRGATVRADLRKQEGEFRSEGDEKPSDSRAQP